MSSTLIMPKRHDIPQPKPERCENCASSLFPPPGHHGECRLNPPTVQMVPSAGKLAGQVEMRAVSAYPPIAKDGYCTIGFRPKNLQ